jgi:hypothetical protein
VKQIPPRGPVKFSRRFTGTYQLHFQGSIVSQARKQNETDINVHVVFLIGLLDSYDGSDVFLENAAGFSSDYTASYPITQLFLVLKSWSTLHRIFLSTITNNYAY